MRSPRVLLIVPTLSSYEAFLTELVEQAHLEGYEVHVATRLRRLAGCTVADRPQKCQWEFFHDIPMPRSADLFGVLNASFQLRKLVAELKPDWIQAHFSAAAFVCAIAKTHSWPFTSCIIQGLASTLARGKARLAAWCGERLAMARLNEMWVLTEDDFKIIKGWNAKKARLQQAPGFGCRLEQFDPECYADEWRSARRSQLSIASDSSVMIYVGRLTVFKGFARVVHAYKSLKEKGLKVDLLVLGEFDRIHSSGLTDGELRNLKADSRVHLMGWKNEVAKWFAIADLCVFPSEREGMPVCLMESLAMGVPVVTADSRGCRDVVCHGVDGIVLEDSNSEQLANTIKSLIQKPKLLQSMREAALARRDQFDRAHFVREHLTEMDVHLSK